MTVPSVEGRFTVVVSAASKHGSTDEIADRIASVLETDLPSDRWLVVRSEVESLATGEYDAVVLGSAIYFGRWMKSARHAVRRLEGEPLLGLWIFSTGPVSDNDEERRLLAEADVGPNPVGVSGQAVFSGRLDTATLSPLERVVALMVGKGREDHREWDQIDAWAHTISADLIKAADEPEVDIR